ncbi:hypothetical protein OIU85_000791 [Salix viminalis]|uniref:Uncharacterized protein n=1 Tax=Salix viminalis TaxID=40686 RepID=A0A9Q0VK99_SALVM|nr:hypothetical protein OIU85_000791 [Salix viminalis]
MQILQNRLVATARKCMGKNASLGQVYGSMQEAYQHMQTPLIYQEPSAQGLKELKQSTIQMAAGMGNIDAPVDETVFDIEREIDDFLPVEVKEQRLSNLLQAIMVILCGLIGIPPSNGVIPQSPMHTKSLATLKHQSNALFFHVSLVHLICRYFSNRLVATARKCMGKNASLGQVYGSMQEAYQHMQTPLIYQEPSAQGLKELKQSTIQMAAGMGNIDAPVDETVFDIEKEIDDFLPVEVKEQRLSNLLQAIMVILCGLIGIPPSNGVIPQSPMHTKSLATPKHQHAKCMGKNASLGQVYGSMQEAYQHMQTPLIYQEPSAQGLKELKQSTTQMAAGMGNIDAPVDETVFDIEKEIDDFLPVEVKEQRLSNLLQAIMVILCGLIGIPPSNGVIPQSPMHTKSLATLKHQILRNRLVATARKCMGKNASLGQVYGSMQEAYQHMQTPLIYQEPSAQGLKELKQSTIQMAAGMGNIDAPVDETVFDIEREIDDFLPVEVKEQRLSNLLQAIVVILCGLIGIPPSNGVIPQSPMHTKSLATPKHQILRNRLVATARKCMGKNASLGQVYGSMQEAYQHMQTPLIYQEPSAQGLKELKQSTTQMAAGMGNIDAPVDETVFDIEKEIDDFLPVEVKEQRLSNLLQAIMVILCGLIGIPPSNGVIPQSPMHTKSLATLKHQILRNRLVATARKCMGKNASLGQVYGSMQEAYQHMQTPLIYQEPSAQGLKELKQSTTQMAAGMGNIDAPVDETVFDIEKEIDDFLPVEVKEQRLSNLLQAIMVILCGLIGIPPSNGVIPQSPMHTKSLATPKHQILRNRLVATARKMYGYPVHQKITVEDPIMRQVFDIEKEIDDFLPVEVKEQRLSNLLQAIMVILCGLIGIPPSNGVIPQSPMHTKSLATLKHQILRNRLVATARKCMGKNASLGQVYGSMQEAYQHMQTPLIYQEPSAQGLKELKQSTIQMAAGMGNIDAPVDETVFDIEREIDDFLPVEVKEQLLKNLLQAIMVGGCVAAMPFVKMIPTS